MADSLASIALEKLTDVLQQQLTLFAGATHELEKLSSTFRSIQALLRDAESRQVADDSVRVWLSKLKHVAYDIDDVLDEGKIWGLGEEGDNDEGDCRNKVRQCLLSPYNCLEHVVSRYKVARHIKEIRERLDEIADDKNKYGFIISSLGGDRMTDVRRQRLTSSLMDKSEKFIGREGDKETIISRLVGESSHEDGGQVHVVVIVGLGGLGKTTLARQIYHDGRVRDHFNMFLWVCVSDVFDATRLTKAILEEVKRTSTSLSELNSVQNELVESLEGRRFLLVLDDVWNDEEEKWKMLRLPLNSGAQGSRILVTTRSDKVANTMRATYIHELEGLSDAESWTLFSSRAFVGRNVEEHPELESVGREIANKCKGVPLSITVIGSAMNSKATVQDWKSVLDSKTWSLSQVTSKILPALLLTYDNLPTHLKQCFVYCSMFPKDWRFEKDTLVRLWVAQGFIHAEESREVEDVGAEYFDELVAWSILRGMDEFMIKTRLVETRYTVHDLLHDLGDFIAKDEIHTLIGASEGRKSGVRHAFVSFTGTGDSSNNMPTILRGEKKLRTLFLNGADDESQKVMVVDLLQQARLLRSVTYQNSKIKMLPNAIGKLKHLRYLDLSSSNIVELPESLSHLHNLQTLNLRFCCELETLPESVSRLRNLQTLILSNCGGLKELPRGIGRMVGLRHLDIEWTLELTYLPKGLGRISGLRRLSKFIVGSEGGEGCRIDELQRLNSLHGSLEILGLARVSSGEEAEKAQLWNKPYLHRLVLRISGARGGHYYSETERMDNVLEGLRPHLNLEELELYWYTGSRLPSWMDVMPNLRKLLLRYGPKMERVPDLPSLKEFKIWELRNERLPDGGGWERLVALQKLQISLCENLKWLPEGLTQLQSLEELELSWCDNLEWLPEGLGQLKKLNLLTINELVALRCLPDSLGQLESLKHLEIRSCYKLKSLPDSLGELKALNRLEISNCKSLGSLPDGLQHLPLLREFEIHDCPLLSERC